MSISAVLFLVVGLPASILLLIEAGWKAGARWKARHPKDPTSGLGAMEGAAFGIMGLLIAFTFSGAAARFEKRRELTVTEANIIGTAYLRLDLLPAAYQPVLKEDFRRYLDSRLAIYRAIPDFAAARARMAESTAIQEEIWNRAVAATKAVETNGVAVTSLVLSSVNEMIDITTERAVALQTHPPNIIFGMLIVLVMAGSLFAGFGMAASSHRSWLHIIGFTVLMALSMYVIFDLEYPRSGLIRIDSVDQVLADLRQSMK